MKYLLTPLVLLVCGCLVLYPVVFLVTESFNVGDPGQFPPVLLGLDNYTNLYDDARILGNTALVACLATIMAVLFGFTLAWILTRTAIPGRAVLERLLELPYYMTPLVGALAWGVLAGPKTGLINQLWRLTGGGDLVDIYTPYGIAWVMALFEGTVAFVMISAAMKSMDPALEESSRVLGAGKLHTALRITLPMVAPGIVSATIFVFAEMLGSFAAAFVLGVPGRFYVVTTAIWQATLSYPPEYGRARPVATDPAARQLRDDYRQGLSAARARGRPPALAAPRALLGLCRAFRRAAARSPAADVVPAFRHRDSGAEHLHPGQLPDRAADGRARLSAGE